MNILVLGGTKLVGRGFVEAALDRGHTLTLFNRGRTHPDRFPGVERIQGDRDGALDALSGRTWDAVYDPSASTPGRVAASVAALKDRVGAYVYISSVSVYPKPVPPGGDLLAERARWDGPNDVVTNENYGGLKTQCEDLVLDAFPSTGTAIRLGLVAGPYDESERWGVWVRRVARGGVVLAPGDPEGPVQVIDGRDAGRFAVHLLETGQHGPYTVTGPSVSLAETLRTMATAAGVEIQPHWIQHETLVAEGLQPWVEFPLWSAPSDFWFWRLDAARAREAGLVCRPLVETARDALAWERSRSEVRGGLTPEREQELLARWGEQTLAP